MKLIIAGSRTLHPSHLFLREVIGHFNLNFDEVVSGTAKGVDLAGEDLANYFDVPVTRFPADWGANGKAAGVIRNAEMAEYADALLLIWDGSSKGSANMKREMTILNKPIYEVILR